MNLIAVSRTQCSHKLIHHIHRTVSLTFILIAGHRQLLRRHLALVRPRTAHLCPCVLCALHLISDFLHQVFCRILVILIILIILVIVTC
jgi:hypothetical protein